MIYVVDGGSLLNQCPELFRPSDDLVESVTDFFERFSAAFEGKGSEAVFVLKGKEGDSSLPKRSRHGPWALMFSYEPADVEDLILETVRLALRRDHVTVVTDNRPRAERAAYLGAARMRCAQFADYLRSAARKARRRSSLDLPQESIQYWCNVFGLDPAESIELKGAEDEGEDRVPED